MISGAERKALALQTRQRRLERWLADSDGTDKTLADAATALGAQRDRLRSDLSQLLEQDRVTPTIAARVAPRVLSRERRETIRTLALAGGSRSEIARELGLPSTYVKEVLKQLRRRGTLPAYRPRPPAEIQQPG